MAHKKLVIHDSTSFGPVNEVIPALPRRSSAQPLYELFNWAMSAEISPNGQQITLPTPVEFSLTIQTVGGSAGEAICKYPPVNSRDPSIKYQPTFPERNKECDEKADCSSWCKASATRIHEFGSGAYRVSTGLVPNELEDLCRDEVKKQKEKFDNDNARSSFDYHGDKLFWERKVELVNWECVQS